MDSGLADSQPMWSTRIRHFLSMHLTQPKVPACSRWGHRVFNQVSTPQPAQAMHRPGQCTQTLRRKGNVFLGSLWILSAKEFVVKRCWFKKKNSAAFSKAVLRPQCFIAVSSLLGHQWVHSGKLPRVFQPQAILHHPVFLWTAPQM